MEYNIKQFESRTLTRGLIKKIFWAIKLSKNPDLKTALKFDSKKYKKTGKKSKAFYKPHDDIVYYFNESLTGKSKQKRLNYFIYNASTLDHEIEHANQFYFIRKLINNEPLSKSQRAYASAMLISDNFYCQPDGEPSSDNFNILHFLYNDTQSSKYKCNLLEVFSSISAINYLRDLLSSNPDNKLIYTEDKFSIPEVIKYNEGIFSYIANNNELRNYYGEIFTDAKLFFEKFKEIIVDFSIQTPPQHLDTESDLVSRLAELIPIPDKNNVANIKNNERTI